MWDMGDASTLFQDAAGATPVTAVTQPIGRVNDKSGLGNNATQSTAGSRPLFSARKNLLTKTEVFTDAAWGTLGVTVTANNATAPDGTLTASTITFPSGGGANQIYQRLEVASAPVTQGVWLRSASTVSVNFGFYDSTSDVQTISVTSVWTYFTKTRASGLTAVDRRSIWIYPSVPATIEIWHPQVEVGSAATSYQRINTASDYDTVGFPAFARFDGVDDSLAISTITLGANMDCFVAVRRNAAAKFMIGSGTTSGAKWFAVVESGSAGAADDSIGIIATYTVDGAPINGGLPLVTRGQLEAALPISGWHVIEVRNLNLSTWSSLYFSGFSGFPLNGDIGGIVLCTAQSTGNRNLIRTYLGAKVGLTL